MSDPIVNRVYNITVQGYQEALNNLTSLTNALTSVDAAKQKADEQLKKAVATGNSAEIATLSAKVAELEANLKNLDKQREASAKEVLILAQAEKTEADARLQNNKALTEEAKAQALAAKAATDKAKADAIVTKSIIDQNKELDRQIAQEEKANQQKIDSAKNTQAEAGSYNALVQAYREALDLLRQTSDTSPVFEKVKADAIAAKLAVDEFNRSLKVQPQSPLAPAVQPGSYTELMASYKQLLELYRQTPPSSPLFEQIKKDAQDAKAQVDAFNRSLSPDGTLVGEYKSGIINAFKNLGLSDVLNQQKKDINNQLQTVISNSELLAAKLRAVGDTGSEAFIEIDTQLKENIKLQLQLEANLRNINTTLEGTGGIGTQVTRAISEEFANLKTNLLQFAVSYVGFQAVISGTTALIHNNAELSDSIANLKTYIHGTKEEAESLVNTLKGIDTRTSLSGLVDIAQSLAQKGVDKSQIAEVTAAFDQYFSVMSQAGKSEDVHEGVFSIAKLISIFNEDHQVTADRVKQLGNAIFSLKTSGPIDNEFLQGFAERVGAVRSITGATIPQILGMGAAFNTLGQSEEVAGSGSSILLSKMIANEAKFASIAGVSVESFKTVIKQNPFEALLQVAEKLQGKGKDVYEDAIKSMGDLGVNAVRVRGAFSEMINNADTFREKMRLAGSAIGDTSGLLDAFNNKQDTFAAKIDKIETSFGKAFSNTSFLNVLTAISNVLLVIVQTLTNIPFAIVVGGLTIGTAAWLAYKGGLTAAKLEQMANNDATLLGYVRLNLMKSGILGKAAAEQAATIITNNATAATAAKVAAMTTGLNIEKASLVILESKVAATEQEAEAIAAAIVAIKAKITATEAEIEATKGATIATEELNTETKFSPWGAILGILAIVIPSLYAYGNSLKSSTLELQRQSNTLKDYGAVEKEIGNAVQNSTLKTKDSLNELISIIKDETNNIDLRKQAYESLIKISPDFIGTLDDQYRATDRLNTAYEKFIDNLDKVARAQAIKNVKQKVEDDKASAQAEVFQAKIAKDQEDANNKLIEQQNKATALKGLTSTDLGGAGTAYANMQKLQDEKAKAYDVALTKAKTADDKSKAFDDFMKTASDDDKKALISGLGENTVATGGTGGSLDDLQKQLASIDKQIESMDAIKNKSAEQLKQLKALRQQRTEITKEIKELGGSVGSEHADKLTPGDKNNLNDLDSQRDAEVAAEKLRVAQIQEVRKLSLQEEIDYQTSLQAIDDKYDQLKIDSIKGNNAAELKERATLELAIVNRKIETNEKIRQLNQKEFDDESNVLKKRLENQKTQTQLAYTTVVDDPNATNTQKATAKKTADDQTYAETVQYYSDVQKLALKYKVDAQTIEEEKQKAIADIIRQSLTDDAALVEAKYKDIEKKYQDASDDIKNKFNLTRDKVLANGGGKSDLDEVDKAENVAQASNDVNANWDKVTQSIQDQLTGKITKQQQEQIYDGYIKAVQKLQGAMLDAQPKIQSLSDLIQSGLRKAFGFKEGDANDKLLGQVLASAYQVGQQAMNAYFDAETNRIEKSKELADSRLDLELNQAKARAQSQAEQASLDQQYAVKKQAEDKKAGEQLKKVKKAEAKIALATELANIGVAAAENPANGVTFGASGAIMYAILAGLALAKYAINISTIDSQQFAGSGQVKPTLWKRVKSFFGGGEVAKEKELQAVNLPSGKIVTASNIPLQPNGDSVLATVKPGEVILNEEHQRKAGGNAFFKRLGVPGFADGGLVQLGGRFGGSIDSLSPPRDPSSFIKPAGASANGSDLQELKQMIAGVNGRIDQQTENINLLADQTNKRIDKIKVQVVAREVITTDANTKKASSIGTIK